MIIKHSNTSNVIRFTLKNSSTGVGLTGLTEASAGLIISTICNNEATATTYTQAGSTIETIAALGTYAAPTATKCRFKEVDATNHKGLYEFQLADTRYAVASARSIVISVTGASSLLNADYEIQLVSFDPYDVVRMGMTALPNAVADAAGGLPISDAGGLGMDNLKAELDGLQGSDGKCAISTDAQDLSGTFDVNTKTATATALDLILKDSTFALAIKDAIWNAILTGATFNIPNSAGRRVREIGAFAIESGTAQAGTSTSITLAATANGEDGIFNRNLIVLTDNTGKGQTRTIVDYNATTKMVLVNRDWRIIPDATTTYQITPDDTALVVDHGKVQAATANTITIRDYASSKDDVYLCNQIAIIAGKGRGQTRLVFAYNGTTKVITICGDDWVEIPDTTSIYVMMPYGTTCASCIGDHALELINAEVVDVLKTDTKGEPVQGVPGATLSIEDKIAYIYKFLRNQVWTTSTGIKVYNDAADTVDHKSTISDDGVTFKRGKFSSGP